MLKRSKLLVAFLAVTVICASVGFAAVSDALNTSGTFKVDANNTEAANQFAENVYFSAVSDTTNMTIGNDGETDAGQSDTLTISVPDNTLKKVGDKYTVTATVTNANTASASISVGNITNANREYVTVTVTAAGDATTIAAHNGTNAGTLVYTIELEMVKVPASDIDATFSFDITATAND